MTVAGEQADTTADANGRWTVEMGPFQAGGPYELKVRGTSTIVVRNVMVGEVWICSGQSNMEFSVCPGPSGWEVGVENYEQEIADALVGHPHVHRQQIGSGQTAEGFGGPVGSCQPGDGGPLFGGGIFLRTRSCSSRGMSRSG